jgi:two-component system sensor histidine kinase KdpD
MGIGKPQSVRAATAMRAYEHWTRSLGRSRWPVRYAVAFISTAVVTAVMKLSGLMLEPANISLIYLIAVLFAATTTGLGPGIAGSILSFLAYNFFFVEPLHILTVASPQDVVRLTTFLFAAILASSLAGLVHHQAEQLGQRAAELESLYTLSQATSAELNLDRVLPIFAARAVELLGVRACAIVVGPAAQERVFAAPDGAAARDAPGAIETPIHAGDRVVGSIRVVPQPQQTLQAPELRLLETLASQAALVIERSALVRQAAEAQALAESDRLKSSLLSSVSHDLRTPLVAIKGIATALREHDAAWNSTAGQQMLETLTDEADRLNRLVGNLLDMSRIESGALQPARAWEDIGDIIGGVLARLRPLLRERPLYVSVPAELPLVWANAGLIDQVLTNLIENALKYTPEQSPLALSAEAQGDEVWVHLVDQGPGISADALPHIFDKFFRVVGPERHAEGTGLGLAICKGIVEAHGGRIWARNRAEGGAEFIFTLPLHPVGGAPSPSPTQAAGQYVEQHAA